jgi:hypothetical protein
MEERLKENGDDHERYDDTRDHETVIHFFLKHPISPIPPS